jgi:hypothetical protein
MAQKSDYAGTVVLGLVGVGVVAFVVNKVYAPPGESWFDKIVGPGPDEDRPEDHHDLLPPPTQQTQDRQAPHPEDSSGPGFFDRLFGGSHTQQAPQRAAPVHHEPGFLERIAKLLEPPAAPKGGGRAAAAPDVVREVQTRLNALHLSVPEVHLPLLVDGDLGRDTARVLMAAQKALGLPATGRIDDKTLAALRKKVSGGVKVLPPPKPRGTSTQPQRSPQYYPAPTPQQLAPYQQHPCPPGMHYEPWAGACVPTSSSHTGADDGSWKSEASSLGDSAVAVIQHVIDSEKNPHTIQSLALLLGKAGLTQTAAAVSAKAPAQATTGDYHVGWPPAGYEGGAYAGYCPPGTEPKCVEPPPTKLVPLTSGDFDVEVISGPVAGYCPPGTKWVCEPTGGGSAVGMAPLPMSRPDFAAIAFSPEVHGEEPEFMGWW